MAEPEAESITDGETPAPPQDASDIARRIAKEGAYKPLPDNAVKPKTTEADER